MTAATSRILVAFAYWSEPLFAGIAARAAEYGWELDQSMRWTRDIPPESEEYDGVIVYANGDDALIRRVLATQAPVVDLENYSDHFDAPKVIGDDRAVGRIAAEHLSRCGVASLVFITPPPKEGHPISAVSRERKQGFAETAENARLPWAAAHENDPLPELPRPIGIFCAGDMLATRVERRILASGLRIPEDVAVLGAHDTAHCCEHAPVPLSSVNVDFERKGRVAAELLHRILSGERPPVAPLVVGPRGVTVRASTRLTPDDDTAFGKLMTVLRTRFAEQIPLEEFTASAGLSLADARQLVRERLDRTLIDELTRIRVDHAQSLLVEGRLNMEGVSTASGFGTRQTLFNAFKRITGKSPDAWRAARLPTQP